MASTFITLVEYIDANSLDGKGARSPAADGTILSQAAQIVSVHVANNAVAPDDLSKLIGEVHRAVLCRQASTRCFDVIRHVHILYRFVNSPRAECS